MDDSHVRKAEIENLKKRSLFQEERAEEYRAKNCELRKKAYIRAENHVDLKARMMAAAAEEFGEIEFEDTDGSSMIVKHEGDGEFSIDGKG